MTARTTLAAGHFFWPVMRDEGGCRRGSVCLGRRKCRHCLLTFRLRGPLTATADFFSLCWSYCNCLRAHNGALSVLRQMLLVCLVNMGAKERTSPSVPCAALTTTTTTTLQIIIRESSGDTENLPESNLNAFRSYCHHILDKIQFYNCVYHIMLPSVYKVWCCNSKPTSCDVTKGTVNSPSVPGRRWFLSQILLGFRLLLLQTCGSSKKLHCRQEAVNGGPAWIMRASSSGLRGEHQRI